MSGQQSLVGNLRIAIYARTSVDDQDNPRLSNSSQVKGAIKLANKLGATVPNNCIFIDIDRSGTTPPTRWLDGKTPTKKNHRVELEKLMVAIENHQIDAVIVYKRDRLFRNLEHSLKFFRFLEFHKIALHATGEHLNSDSSASSKLELHLAMAVAQYLIDTTKENVKKAKLRQKTEGMKMGCCQTFGYFDGPKRGTVEVDKDAMHVVRDVFKRYIAGESRGQIVEWLNQCYLGMIPSRGKKFCAKKWYRSHVSRILANPHYIGQQIGIDGNLVQSTCYRQEIDWTIWQNAQECRKSRRNAKHGKKFCKHLVSGFLKCGYCGANLTCYSRYHKTERRRVGFEFKCAHKHSKGKHPANIREFIWDDFISDEYGYPMEKDPSSVPIVLTDAKIRLDRIRQNLLDLEKGYARAELQYDEWFKTKSLIVKNKERLEAEISKAEAEREVDDIVWVVWDDMSCDARRRRLIERIDHISVFCDHIVVVIPDGQKTVYPVCKRHFAAHKSQRPFNSLLPSSFCGWACSIEWGDNLT